MMYVEPQAGSGPVLQIIQAARTSLDVNAYYFSSRPLLRALGSAHRRGVLVRVILEPRPYGFSASRIAREYQLLRATGATVTWASQPGLDHAKYICNRSSCEIGTANYDWSAFHRNREYLYVTANPSLVHATRNLFEADWQGSRVVTSPSPLLVAPVATPALIAILAQPGPLDVEMEEVGDYPAVLRVLEAKGAQVRLLVPPPTTWTARRSLGALAQAGVQVRLLGPRPVYLHAKMILGEQVGFIGSQNLSRSSLTRNRELGVRLTGPDLIPLRRQFAADWQQSRPLANLGSQEFH